jgi:hypothetical protein
MVTPCLESVNNAERAEVEEQPLAETQRTGAHRLNAKRGRSRQRRHDPVCFPKVHHYLPHAPSEDSHSFRSKAGRKLRGLAEGPRRRQSDVEPQHQCQAREYLRRLERDSAKPLMPSTPLSRKLVLQTWSSFKELNRIYNKILEQEMK